MLDSATETLMAVNDFAVSLQQDTFHLTSSLRFGVMPYGWFGKALP